MPACRAAPRATTSLTASELSGALPVSSLQHLPRHRHVRRAADQQHAIDLVPASGRPAAAPAASSAACAISRSRVSVSNSARVSGTVSTLPRVRAGDGRLRQLAQRPLGPLGGGAAAPASDCGSVRGSSPCCFMNWSAT